MPFDYSDTVQVAVEALAEFGVSATVGLGSDQRTVNVLLNKVMRHTFPDAVLQTGDREYLMEPSGNPVEGERMEVDGEKLVIVFKMPIKPGNTVILWYVYGRRG